MYAIDQCISYDLRPMSTVVLTVKMVKQETPPLDAGMFEILMISMESEEDLQNLESSIDNDSQKNDDDLLKRVEELDGEVHAAVLKAVICPPKDPAPKVSLWSCPFQDDMVEIMFHVSYLFGILIFVNHEHLKTSPGGGFMSLLFKTHVLETV